MLTKDKLSRDLAISRQAKHLETLERELKENPCLKLQTHILRLKVAWQEAPSGPLPHTQAA
jgi:hypothetical protein